MGSSAQVPGPILPSLTGATDITGEEAAPCGSKGGGAGEGHHAPGLHNQATGRTASQNKEEDGELLTELSPARGGALDLSGHRVKPRSIRTAMTVGPEPLSCVDGGLCH